MKHTTVRQGTEHTLRGDFIETMKAALKIMRKNDKALFLYCQVCRDMEGTPVAKDILHIVIYEPDSKKP